MNRIKLILSSLMIALLCIAASCKGSGGDDPTPDNPAGPDNPTPQETAKYLTAAEFQSSYWKGKQKDENIMGPVELKVSASQMDLVYYYSDGLSKNNKNYKQKTVKISPYTFDAKSGKFSGTGDDKVTYAGELFSKTQLQITLPSETVTLSKQ